ncbi:MAG: hypothetical protein PHY56_06270 [Candidatus Omnitrophica bacterium]|jgi:calcineurin-like phosphoesterase family protein|nr:hypothetical protein [Candidatus Omnitrophota bacterium]
MTTIWLTADLHLGHANIIKYCNRPFKDVEEMDKTLIRKWNERVKPEDTIIHVGDFCFKNSAGGKIGEGGLNNAAYYQAQLKGNIVFIKGNHDSHNSLRTKIKSLILEYGNDYYFVIHDPNNANIDYKFNLVGHIHNQWQIITAPFDYAMADKCILYNVGVDVHNFYPVSMQEIINNIAKWNKTKQEKG